MPLIQLDCYKLDDRTFNKLFGSGHIQVTRYPFPPFSDEHVINGSTYINTMGDVYKQVDIDPSEVEKSIISLMLDPNLSNLDVLKRSYYDIKPNPSEYEHLFLCSPQAAVRFARAFGPSDKTRIKACEDAESAYYYAMYVDEEPREETWRAVKDNDWLYHFFGLRDGMMYHYRMLEEEQC